MTHDTRNRHVSLLDEITIRIVLNGVEKFLVKDWLQWPCWCSAVDTRVHAILAELSTRNCFHRSLIGYPSEIVPSFRPQLYDLTLSWIVVNGQRDEEASSGRLVISNEYCQLAEREHQWLFGRVANLLSELVSEHHCIGAFCPAISGKTIRQYYVSAGGSWVRTGDPTCLSKHPSRAMATVVV